MHAYTHDRGGALLIVADLARSLGNRLAGALELPVEAAERAAYALELLFLDVLTLLAITGFSFLAGVFAPALAATATIMVMRTFSGGAHSDSPWRCLIVSTVLALGLGFLGRAAGPLLTPTVLHSLLGAITIPGLIVVIRHAPADTPAKPIPPRQAKVLKGLALVLLLLWCAGAVLLPVRRDLLAASMGGMIWQIFSVTPAGYWLAARLDRLGRKGVLQHA